MRKRSGGAAILLYHRVANADQDSQQLCVTTDNFRAHLRILRRSADLVDIEDARRKGHGRRVAITFDDGYQDNASVAAPILAEQEVPGAFFVTSGFVGTTRLFWWDRLEGMLLSSSPLRTEIDLEIGRKRLWVDIRSPAGKERAYWALHTRLRMHPPSMIQGVLEDLAGQMKAEIDEGGSSRVVNESELKELASGSFRVGSHTVSHPFLSSLPIELQRREIADSRTELERLSGSDVSIFAYPFGGEDSYDDETITLVEEAGYGLAFVNEPLLATPKSHPLRLPRYLVRDWTGEEFASKLSEWFDE